jgi:phosphotransferase system, enzyme I, PtsP
VRKRYDSLDGSYLKFLQHIITRCEQADTKLSYCGEDAGRPIEALCLAAIGINTLSMRPASIGPVKHLLIRTDLSALKTVIEQAYSKGGSAVRNEVNEFFLQQTK